MTDHDIITQAAEQAAIEAVQKIQDAIQSAVETAARTGAEVGIYAAESERNRIQKELRNKQFHNTKLLLQKYNILTSHCANAVYKKRELAKAQEETASIEDLMQMDVGGKCNVESIQNSAARTQLILEHINRMLTVYRAYCEQAGPEAQRHYRVITSLYIKPSRRTVEEVMEQEHISKRTVYKDIDKACSILSTLFFGIDAVKK